MVVKEIPSFNRPLWEELEAQALVLLPDREEMDSTSSTGQLGYPTRPRVAVGMKTRSKLAASGIS
jgi:hypothetical protein